MTATIFGATGAANLGAIFDLDAGDSASYSGSGQTWANLTATPADGSAKTAYDFTNNLYTFNGTAGNESVNEYWEPIAAPNSSYFRIASGSNTTFLNSLHKNNAAFTFLAWIKTPVSITSGTLFATRDTSSSTNAGINIALNSSGSLGLTQSSGTAIGLSDTSSTGLVTANAIQLVGFSFDEAAGQIVWHKNTTNESASASYSTTSATNPQSVAIIGAAGQSTYLNPLRDTNIFRVMLFRRAIGAAAMDSIYNQQKARYGL